MKNHPKSNKGVFSKKQRKASRHLCAVDRENARTNTAIERQRVEQHEAKQKAKAELEKSGESSVKKPAAGPRQGLLRKLMRVQRRTS